MSQNLSIKLLGFLVYFWKDSSSKVSRIFVGFTGILYRNSWNGMWSDESSECPYFFRVISTSILGPHSFLIPAVMVHRGANRHGHPKPRCKHEISQCAGGAVADPHIFWTVFGTRLSPHSIVWSLQYPDTFYLFFSTIRLIMVYRVKIFVNFWSLHSRDFGCFKS